MYKGEDRRKHKRIQKRYIVSFQVRAHGEKKETIGGWDMVAVLDLGAGGMLFYYDKKLEMDSLLDLKINFDPDRGPIKCVGKVIRSEELFGAYMFLSAVVFQDISEEEKTLIDKVAEEYCSKKPAKKNQ